MADFIMPSEAKQESVNTLNSKITNLIKYADVSVTTNQYGNAGLTYNANKVINVTSCD